MRRRVHEGVPERQLAQEHAPCCEHDFGDSQLRALHGALGAKREGVAPAGMLRMVMELTLNLNLTSTLI